MFVYIFCFVLLNRIFLGYVKSSVERTTRQSLPQTSCTLWDSILDSWGITIIDEFPVFILLCVSYEEKLLTQCLWALLCLHLFPMSLCFFFIGHIGSFWRLWWTSFLSLCMVSCLVFVIFDHQLPHCVFKSSFIETSMIMKSWVFDNVCILRLVG